MKHVKRTSEYLELPVASELETISMLEQARSFISKTGGLYSSASDIARLAIADYIAFTEGKQLKRN